MASAGMCSPRSDHNCEDKAPLRMRDGKSTDSRAVATHGK